MRYKIVYIITCFIIILFTFGIINQKETQTKSYSFIDEKVDIEKLKSYKPTFNIITPEIQEALDKQYVAFKKQEEEKAKLEEERIRLEQEQELLRIQQEELKKQKQKELEVAKVKQEPTSRNSESTRNDGEWISFTATGYCSCSQCCGKNTGITAMGTKARANHTLAMPSNYSFGTQIEIQGMGVYTVEDRGGAIKGNILDIYFNSHQEALNWGRRAINIRVVQ